MPFFQSREGKVKKKVMQSDKFILKNLQSKLHIRSKLNECKIFVWVLKLSLFILPW